MSVKKHLTAPNILNREFECSNIGDKYAIDITYLPIPNKMVYLTACIDLCSREVVELNISLKQDVTFIVSLINKLRNKHSLVNSIIHTDQGVHFKIIHMLI